MRVSSVQAESFSLPERTVAACAKQSIYCGTPATRPSGTRIVHGVFIKALPDYHRFVTLRGYA